MLLIISDYDYCCDKLKGIFNICGLAYMNKLGN